MLTPAQHDQLHLRTQALLQAALSTAPLDPAEAKAALADAYALAQVPMPPVAFVASPQQAVDLLLTQGPARRGRPVPAFDVQDALASQADAVRQLLTLELSARNPNWQKLGDEVDLQFNRENFMQIIASQALRGLSDLSPGWFPEELPVLQFKHAVDEALEARYTHQHDNWLLYSGGSANLWGALGEFAQMEGLLVAGELPAPTPTYAAGRRLLSSCGWLFALEKLCVVCERPAALSHPKLHPDGDPEVVQVTWRDGTVCRMAWQDDEDDWNDDGSYVDRDAAGSDPL